MNRVILFGRLGQDPEVRNTANGGAVLSFSLATDDGRKDASGEWVKTTTWHRCAVFGRQAEALGRILTKGKQVLIEGKIRNSSYEDKDGVRRTKSEVIVDKLELGARGDGGGAPSGSGAGFTPEPGSEDDMPF